ncbi:hypothetical protein BEQ56_09320 [Anaerolineaceae bacterium oral taxon 439]|nr:hypothetical protein BEQ56_09320 [Anaerolineaceae bacterium oral taxon 439]
MVNHPRKLADKEAVRIKAFIVRRGYTTIIFFYTIFIYFEVIPLARHLNTILVHCIISRAQIYRLKKKVLKFWRGKKITRILIIRGRHNPAIESPL